MPTIRRFISCAALICLPLGALHADSPGPTTVPIVIRPVETPVTPAPKVDTNAVAMPVPVKVGGRKTIKRLAPGVTFTQQIDPAIPIIIHVVTVDLSAPGVHVEVGMGQDQIGGMDPTEGREDVSRFARRHRALVAVNGDYFPFTGDPLGLAIHHGELLSEPWMGDGKGGPREVLGILSDSPSIEDRASESPFRLQGGAEGGGSESRVGVGGGGFSRAIIDRLGFRGDLQAADGGHYKIHGVDRVVGKDEIVVMTPGYRGARINRPGGTDVTVTGVNLPLRANKRMLGVVQSIRTTADGVDIVPADGVVLAGGPGKGGIALTAHMRPGDTIGFVMGVGTVADPAAGIKIASLPRASDDLPSRDGRPIDRTAWLWGTVPEALGGGPRLLAGGNIAIDAAEDGFGPGFTDLPNPRTAVGLSDDGRKLIIVTVDGRQTISRGMSMTDLAAILKESGATEGMNLDGGGSTVMAVAGITVDSPGGTGAERPVADMLVVSSDRPYTDIPDWDPAGRAPAVWHSSVRGATGASVADQPRLLCGKKTFQVGQTANIVLTDGRRTIKPDDIVWQGPVEPSVPFTVTPTPPLLGVGGSSPSVEGRAGVGSPAPPLLGAGGQYPIGFVDQRGCFTALRAGTGAVTALYRGHLITTPVTVAAPPAPLPMAAIRASFSKDRSEPDNRGILVVHVARGDGRPIAGANLRIAVTGGSADSAVATTDPDGAATIDITWDQPTGGLVTVSSTGLASLTLGQIQ